MPANRTPEEKLLNLIRKKKRPGGQGIPGGERLLGILKRAGEYFGYLSGKLLLLIEKIGLRKKLNKPALFYVNKSLIICNIILAVFAVKGIYTLVNFKDINFKPAERNAALEKTSNNKKERPLSYYLQNMRGNMFKSAEPEVRNALSAGQPGKPALADIIKDMSVSGIVIDGQRVQAVIIDSAKNQTYFVYKGDNINNIKIEKILENKVVVSCGDEQAEIGMR